jgi:hypothetical protein
MALAVVMTTAGGVAIALPLVTANRVPDAGLASDESGEIITYIQPVKEAPARPNTTSQSVYASRAVRALAPSEPARDTSSLPVSGVTATIIADTVAHTAGNVAPTVARPLGAFPAFVAFNPSYWSATYTPLLDPADFLRPRPLTAAQRDSIEREKDRLAQQSHGEHRSMAMPLGGVSLPVGLPMFTHVPSREERLRDSIVNADNLERLARLAARARAKHDSLLATRSP